MAVHYLHCDSPTKNIYWSSTLVPGDHKLVCDSSDNLKWQLSVTGVPGGTRVLSIDSASKTITWAIVG